MVRAEPSRDVRRDRRLLGLLLLVCGGSAIATLPSQLVHPGWIVAFVLPAGLYATLGKGWRPLLVATLFQLGLAAVAYVWLGPLKRVAALALLLLPLLTFYTVRRQPRDAGLALFLSFCVLLIGTMLSLGQNDWRLLVFLCSSGLAMQVEASTRASLVRHAHRTAPASRLKLGASRTQLMALMLLVGSLLYLGMAAVPRSDLGSTPTKPSREPAGNRRTVGLSHEFDLTGAEGSPLRIEAKEVLVATAGDVREVPPDLYLRMTYFDMAERERWSTAVPHTTNEYGRAWDHVVVPKVARHSVRSLSVKLKQSMPGGELFVPTGAHRIFGVEPLELDALDAGNGWFRAPTSGDNRNYWVDYQRTGDLAWRASLQDRQDPHLTYVPGAFRRSTQLAQLLASFTRGLPRRSTIMARAHRITAGLQSRCRYALREPAGDQEDTLRRFLFGSREGYCMHFATALAVMLRLQHIPCRIAVGFYGGDPVPGDPIGMSRVYGAQHAHAWVEIPLELGNWKAWAVVDATPPADRTKPGWPPRTGGFGSVSQPKQGKPEAGACMLSAVTPLLDGPLGFLDSPLHYPHTLVLLGVLIVLGIFWTAVMFLRERRGQQPVARDARLTGDRHRARQLLGQILRALRHYPRPYNCTLESYVEHLRAADVVADLDAVAGGFRTYQEVRFGSHVLDDKRLRVMQAALASARRTAS